MRSVFWPLPILTCSLAACTTHRAPPVVAEVPAPAVAPAPPLPAGATPGMLVPQPEADGSFRTPNQGLTGAAAIWHLRAGLNVAALSCPGEEGAAIRAGYNAWLKRDKAPLARAATGYAAQYRAAAAAAGGYDDAMTRLYNYYAQTPVRPGLCTAAAGIAAEAATLDPAALAGFAETRLATLDQPFTDFYRAYDAWRSGRPQAVIAAAAVAPSAPIGAPVAMASLRPGSPARRPALTLDLADLPADTVVAVSR